MLKAPHQLTQLKRGETKLETEVLETRKETESLQTSGLPGAPPRPARPLPWSCAPRPPISAERSAALQTLRDRLQVRSGVKGVRASRGSRGAAVSQGLEVFDLMGGEVPGAGSGRGGCRAGARDAGCCGGRRVAELRRCKGAVGAGGAGSAEI